MALKKSELYSSLWSSCDELRGGMDASQYKDYVLVLLFIKYVSDKYAGVRYAPITIPEGASFKDMVALKGKPDIGDQINKKIIAPLANANKLSDMPDFNDATKLGSGKEMVDRLTNLIATFENKALDFSKNRADGDDILGDAYEYLMRHFATESGKSKGQFYTPAQVSRIMAKIIGGKLVVEITPRVVKRYETNRLSEKAGPKTINDEVLLLLRLCGDQGDLIRAKLRREKAMKLATPPSPGRAYTADEKARMLAEAAMLRSENMYPALVVDLNCGLRDKELRELRWQQIDLVNKKALTVGKSKTAAGTGRVIPLNDTVLVAIEAHAAWYIRRFGECRPEWYVFPAGKGQPNDPTRPVTTLRTAWTKVREKAKVVGRWHDNRHTLVTELAESGTGDEVIMSIAGHVSRAMRSRYSHCGWKRNGAPSTRFRRASAHPTRSARRKPTAEGCGGSPRSGDSVRSGGRHGLHVPI
jgi:integrase